MKEGKMKGFSGISFYIVRDISIPTIFNEGVTKVEQSNYVKRKFPGGWPCG